MPLATWPVTVTLDFQANGYREMPQRTIDQFQVDHGGPLESLATIVPTTLIQGTILCMTAAEYEDLLEFYEDTLYQGLLHFTRAHPRTEVAAQEFKFEEFTLSSVVAGTLHYVDVTLRYYPPV